MPGKKVLYLIQFVYVAFLRFAVALGLRNLAVSGLTTLNPKP